MLGRGLSQGVQFSAQLVYLIADVVHLRTQSLVACTLGVKLSLVLAALLVRRYLWVKPAWMGPNSYVKKSSIYFVNIK